MITVTKDFFLLQTNNTAYCFQATKSGALQHVYYGARLMDEEDYLALVPNEINIPGNAAAIEDGTCFENMALEAGTIGIGDVREPLVDVCLPDGSHTLSLAYLNYSTESINLPKGLPCAEGADNVLKVTLKNEEYQLYLELCYAVFEKTDTIVRWTRICNDSEETIVVERLLSNQLDLPEKEYTLHTFRGAWVREMEHFQESLVGKNIWDSVVGTSSNRCNPFAMVADKEAAEQSGNVYAFNLIYSGNHIGIAERNSFGSVRVLQGMNKVRWMLGPKGSLDSPQAVMTFSPFGFTGISDNMHEFVKKHIIRKAWQNKERPVLCNSWEAMYFKVDHKRIADLGKQAKDLGIELLVMDDGWFTGRKDDRRALGDWMADKKKLPQGIAGVAKEINDLGLDFGIWVEPEMTNADSDLYRAHPDWILGREKQALGRNQYVLDLSREDVCDYIYDSMAAILSGANVKYVKWDMNRIHTDVYSSTWEKEHQGEVEHRYMLGLYGILSRLNRDFPEVLFEGCASGGNRSDLGILCYMPQLWASDNTEAYCRTKIQEGYSYGYPQSVLGCHVSAVPNHQTLRATPLHTRLQVASLGLLGFELDLGALSKEEKEEIKTYIAFYKEHRGTFQFGKFYRNPINENEKFFNVVNEKQDEAFGVHFVTLNQPNAGMHPIKVNGLNPIAKYKVTQQSQAPHLKDFGTLVNMISPITIKQGSLVETIADKAVKLKADEVNLTMSGSALQDAGFYPVQAFSGTGFGEGTRVMKDFDSRIYIFEGANQ